MLTVADLKAALDEYGDHLPVVIVVDQGERDRVLRDIDVDARTFEGTTHLTLTVEL